MPLFPVDDTPAHEDAVQQSTTLTNTPASGFNDEWLKVGQSYRYHPPAPDQRSSPADPASTDEGANLQSPSEIEERRPRASNLFKNPTGSPGSEARDHSEEESSDGKHGNSRQRGKADKHGDSRGKGKRKRYTRSSSLSSDGAESSDDGSPRHRKKGRKREHDRKGSRHHRQNRDSTRKSSKGSRNRRDTLRRHKTSRSNSEDSRRRQSSSRRSTASPPPDNQLFVEDRRGDPDNLTFGGFYRLDVPVYHSINRTGKLPRNRTSGKSARYFASQVRSVNDDGHISRMQLWKGQKRRDQARLWSHASASLPSAKASAQAKYTGASGEASEVKEPRNSPEFLPVDHTVVSQDAEIANSNDDESGDDNGTLSTESLEQWVTRRTKEFNRATREQPNSEELWLQYADFQDEAVRALHGSTSVLTPSTAIVRMTLEKRASVLEGALHRNPGSVVLRMAHLQLAEQLQEHDAVDSLWRKALVKTEYSSTVWLRYLKFKSGHFASFSASSQRRLYSRSIRALESKGKQASIAHEKKERAEGVFIMGKSMLKGCKETLQAEAGMLDALWSYCVEERAAGYRERALGALQAMLELNIQSHSSSVSVNDLEQYWDSEAPRIGDAHPSHAGIARWLKTQAAPSSSVTSPEDTVDPELANLLARHRPPPAERPLRLRPQRKRAVDFFARDESSLRGGAVQTRDPTDTSLSGNVGGRDRVEPKTENGSSDVLESAYRAAVALAASGQIDTIPSKGHASVHDANTAKKTPPAPGREGIPKEPGTAPNPEQHFVPPANVKGKSKASRPVTESSSVVEKKAAAVDAEGLIWVDESQGTAYSVRHGYRIDVQNAVDSVSGLEYGRILTQMQGGDAPDTRRRGRTKGERAREEELLKEAAVLEDVSDQDPFCTWAEQEDDMTRREWQPLRALVDPEGAEEQPDRVVFVEDLKPLLFHVSQPCSLRILVAMLLSSGGLAFPRSCCSHSPRALSDAVHASSLGNGGWSVSLVAAVEHGLQAVWTACGGDLLTSGESFSKSFGRPASFLPAPSINLAADQFLLLTDDVIGDPSRQSFLRNVLHHLIRSPELLPSEIVEPGAPTTTSCVRGTHADILVQLQCALMVFEGWLAAAATSRLASRDSPDDDDMDRGRDARKVAKSLLEASQASATDLRLWCSYVQLLALLDCRQEAIKVAEKALSMVQDLPTDKKPQSAELFWLAFRLRAGLPLSPRDSCADAAIVDLFRERDAGAKGSREMALHVLCSFAEGTFKRTKTKKPKRDGKGSRSETAEAAEVTPPRLMTARRLMAEHVARISADLRQGANGGASHQPGEALDMTPPLMYYSACWVWLEYLTRGPEQAEQAMSESLKAANYSRNEEIQGTAVSSGIGDSRENESSHVGNQSYRWRVVPEGDPLAVCLERMHRAFCEVLVLAQQYNAAATGPRRVRAAILRGLQSFPAEPGMLALFLDAEKFSGSQQRLVHHLFEVSRRRALTWEQGPTGVEWVLAATHQVKRCVSEAREAILTAGHWEERDGDKQESDETLLVKNWADGSYSRLQRWMETAVTHPTGRGMPLLWRMYMSLEAMRGHHTRAKHLFWRAIHACPGSKAVWMDAFRGKSRGQTGVAGLRPAFREKELQEILDALLEKSLHIRGEPP